MLAVDVRGFDLDDVLRLVLSLKLQDFLKVVSPLTVSIVVECYFAVYHHVLEVLPHLRSDLLRMMDRLQLAQATLL